MNARLPKPAAQATPEDPFHVEPDQPGFESLAQSDGFRFWWASDLARLLGYQEVGSFRKAMQKAMVACDALPYRML